MAGALSHIRVLDLSRVLAGSVPLVAGPMQLSKTPLRYKNPPPTLGQHTGQVLDKLLDLDRATLERLADEGVI